MKNIVIVIVSLIVGFCAGKFSLIKLQQNLYMTKLEKITVIDGDTVHAVIKDNICQ
ncbi:MAG: hypothetical protein VZR09_09400 [Candidatus Gastranaerophilaceae bacterium]|nr:hypothetical protein [Candidatus Gastranaerophilaceae bacterium]